MLDLTTSTLIRDLVLLFTICYVGYRFDLKIDQLQKQIDELKATVGELKNK